MASFQPSRYALAVSADARNDCASGAFTTPASISSVTERTAVVNVSSARMYAAAPLGSSATPPVEEHPVNIHARRSMTNVRTSGDFM